jgi:predicted NACHT family NTPase
VSFLRAFNASPLALHEISQALLDRGLTKSALAEMTDVSRTTISSLFAGRPIEQRLFVKICLFLELDWRQLSEVAEENLNLVESSITIRDGDIEILAQRMREQCSAGIEQRCGLMRILDMTTPIDSGTIYTSVNILERIASKTRQDLDDLMQGSGPEGFNRFMLGRAHEKRVDGLDAVADKKLLIVLGRPGAGKTTFLKRLAMLCRSGDFLGLQVPIFVTLKEWAESPGKPELLEFVGRYFSESIDSVKTILTAGRGLVLLDGLDEVLERDHDRVLTEICNFAEAYKANQIVITCRIAAREYIFQQFTEVEVADFSDEQIQEFADRWFLIKEPMSVDTEGKSIVGKLFWNALQEREPVRELAANPLLLTLLCLEFENSAEFPKSRTELYERGLYLLLSKWDGQRRIQRDSAYGKLSVKRKESLLAQLAIATFERGDYFFKQRVAEQQIGNYIQNLPEAKTDPEALLVDSREVLRDIVAQHALLTERARGIYSFSHLTFHEYFAARSIVDSSNPEKYERAVNQLMAHVGDKRWREIFLLVVERSDDAGYVLTLMKYKIDEFLAEDKKIQQFLDWINQKSIDTKIVEKQQSVRAFYCYRFLFFDRELDRDFDRELNRVLDRAQNLSHSRARARALSRALSLSLSQDLLPSLIGDRDRNPDVNIDGSDLIDVDLVLSLDDRNLEHELQQFQSQLPDFEGDIDYLQSWWENNGENWTEKLRSVMKKYRNIGHDWQFSESQKILLNQYYDSNSLLMECLKSECYANRNILQEIEDTTFLSIAEIEKRAQR